MPNNMNLHRNIFFKSCAHVPAMPFTALDLHDPSDLWKWMDDQRKVGNELLAISHNANLSDGRMYPTEVDLHGRPIDKAYADDRMRNEPLIEIKQTKGQSETHPLLSPNDEFANFQIWALLLGDPTGRIPHIVGSYARQALKDGLALEDTKGFNPYKFGFGAASNSHATAVPYRQDNYFGTIGTMDGSIERRMSGIVAAGLDLRTIEPAGLTGVWAEENTRELDLRGHATQRDFRGQRPAHQGLGTYIEHVMAAGGRTEDRCPDAIPSCDPSVHAFYYARARRDSDAYDPDQQIAGRPAGRSGRHSTYRASNPTRTGVEFADLVYTDFRGAGARRGWANVDISRNKGRFRSTTLN